MAFWLLNRKHARKGSKKGTGKLLGLPAAKAGPRANNALLHRLGCTACPLNTAPVTTPKMAPTLVDDPVIYFMAEAPGADEDLRSGRPLTGPTGKLLRSLIPEKYKNKCSFDNVVNCRPSDENRTPVWNEIECCHPRREKYIGQNKPILIVGLGAIPLQWALNSTDLSGLRGRFFAIKVGNHACWFMPTYQPSFILRVARKKNDPLNSMFGHCLKMDIQRAFDYAKKLKPPTIDSEEQIRDRIDCFDGSQPNHFDDLCLLLDQSLQQGVVATDLETKGLRPYAKGAAIMTASVSFQGTNFAFAIDHPNSKWPARQLETVLGKYRKLIKSDVLKIAHNAVFECEWLAWLFGRSVINHVAWECTQVQAHFICERRGSQARGASDSDRKAVYQSLDFLCKMHFGIKLKGQFKLDKKDMSKSDLGETLIYNGADSKYTLRLWHTQNQLLEDEGSVEAYLDSVSRQPTIALMQSFGIPTDQKEVVRINNRLGKELAEVDAEINALPVVQQFKADHKGQFKVLSSKDVLSIFRDYLKRSEIMLKDGEKVRFSTDKRILETIDHPLARLILEYRNRYKLKSTYSDGIKAPDGEYVYDDLKTHCNFNSTFAETGRTSSDEPNMQNVTAREVEIKTRKHWMKNTLVRKQWCAEKGHVLVAMDYGQLEGCTGAMCSGDKVLVKALWEDYDIHMEWSERLAHKIPDMIGGIEKLKDEKFKSSFRSLIKNKLVFPAIFGASTESIASYLKLPVNPETKRNRKLDQLMEEFWREFSGLAKWQRDLMKFYYETGYVASPNGRRRRYPLTKNQAINHPIQCLACDIVCHSMNSLSLKAAETGKWYLHPILNIHDDLTFMIPDKDDILCEAIQEIYNVMLTPPYECVNVPLSVKASLGHNWHEMTTIGSFWSHKDL